MFKQQKANPLTNFLKHPQTQRNNNLNVNQPKIQDLKNSFKVIEIKSDSEESSEIIMQKMNYGHPNGKEEEKKEDIEN